MIEATGLRLRPILTTRVAAMLGTAPLLLSSGEGWQMRRPPGLAIVGGLVVSQCLTLYTTPAMYLLMTRLRRRRASAIAAPTHGERRRSRPARGRFRSRRRPRC